MSTGTASALSPRERVEQLAQDVHRLCRSDVSLDDFFPQFLRLTAAALNAQAAALWWSNPQEAPLPRAELKLALTELADDAEARRRNEQLVAEVRATGEGRFVAPDTEAFPRRHLLVLVAMQDGADSHGVAEFFLRPDVPPQAHATQLLLAEQFCGLASRYLRRRSAGPADVSATLSQYADFVLRLQRSRTLAETAATAASDGRLLLGCDRVSVVVRRGRAIVVQAVSGQDSVHPRANLVRALRDLVRPAMNVGKAIRFSGLVEEIPPPLEKPMADFVHESGAKSVLLVPLVEPPPPASSGDLTGNRASSSRPRRVLGCLVVEQFGDTQIQPALLARVDRVADHIAAALDQSLWRERIPLSGVWQAAGRSREWFRGRGLWKTLAILGLLAMVGLTLALVPWDYRVEGEGRLMPAVQREVFAPTDGEVAEVFVTGGQRVAAGDPLVRLENDELRTQLVRVRSELAQKQEQAAALGSQIDAAIRQADRTEETRLQGERAETLAEISGLEQQERTLARRAERLTVRAPIDGVVATFQVEQLLAERPVRRGEVLLEVMNERGPWRLELEIEEHRLGHLLRARQDLGTNTLPVEYLLATVPEETYPAQLETLATRAVPSEERGNIVEAFAAVPPGAAPPELRIGAQVRAKIHCGRRSLGYVLFGDVIEFCQKWLWL